MNISKVNDGEAAHMYPPTVEANLISHRNGRCEDN